MIGDFYFRIDTEPRKNVSLSEKKESNESISIIDDYHNEMRTSFYLTESGLLTQARSFIQCDSLLSLGVKSFRDFEKNSRKLIPLDSKESFAINKIHIFDEKGVPIRSTETQKVNAKTFFYRDSVASSYDNINDTLTICSQQRFVVDSRKESFNSFIPSFYKIVFKNKDSINYYTSKDSLIDYFILQNDKIIRSKNYTYEYTNDGYLSKLTFFSRKYDIKSQSFQSTLQYYEYKYLRFDNRGNWTKRLRYESETNSIRLQTREIFYY